MGLEPLGTRVRHVGLFRHLIETLILMVVKTGFQYQVRMQIETDSCEGTTDYIKGLHGSS